jgi:hypothetical protein
MGREIESSTGLFEKNVLYVHTSAILTRKKKKSCFFCREESFSHPRRTFLDLLVTFFLQHRFLCWSPQSTTLDNAVGLILQN